MNLLFAMYALGGLLLIALAVPLVQRLVKPNMWYGFRVPKTLENPDIWYDANAYVGRYLFWVGVATLVTAAGLYFFARGISLDTYALACAGVSLGLLTVTVVQGFRYLGQFKDE